MKKIVSHLNPRHLDDFIAVSIVKNLTHAPLELIYPQGVPQEYLKDPEICLLDVGLDYNPHLNNFDHHQDISLSCSCVLVMENLSDWKLFIEHPAIKFIDFADRFGIKKALQVFNVPLDRQIDKMRRIILFSAEETSFDFEKTASLIFNSLKSSTDYNSFIRALFKEMENNRLLEYGFKREEEENIAYYQKIQEAKIFEIEGLKVIVSEKSFAPFYPRVFSGLKIDVIIEPNPMNPLHTSIIKNTYSPKTSSLKLYKVFETFPRVFMHQNGFIAVINIPVSQIDPFEIIRKIL